MLVAEEWKSLQSVCLFFYCSLDCAPCVLYVRIAEIVQDVQMSLSRACVSARRVVCESCALVSSVMYLGLIATLSWLHALKRLGDI